MSLVANISNILINVHIKPAFLIYHYDFKIVVRMLKPTRTTILRKKKRFRNYKVENFIRVVWSKIVHQWRFPCELLHQWLDYEMYQYICLWCLRLGKIKHNAKWQNKKYENIPLFCIHYWKIGWCLWQGRLLYALYDNNLK